MKSVCFHLGKGLRILIKSMREEKQIKEREVKRCRKDFKTLGKDDNQTNITNLYLMFTHWLSLFDYLFIWVAYLSSLVVNTFQLQHLAKSFSLHWLPKIHGYQITIKNKLEIFFFFLMTQPRQDLFLSFVKALTKKEIIPQGKGKRGKCFEGGKRSSREMMICSSLENRRGSEILWIAISVGLQVPRSP